MSSQATRGPFGYNPHTGEANFRRERKNLRSSAAFPTILVSMAVGSRFDPHHSL
jgi:hypothetical protein